MNMIKFNEIKSEPLFEDRRELGSENNSINTRLIWFQVRDLRTEWNANASTTRGILNDPVEGTNVTLICRISELQATSSNFLNWTYEINGEVRTIDTENLPLGLIALANWKSPKLILHLYFLF
jgi:hypothetical protein